ncbi:hypothetical protein AcW1_000031 [Taiwanofungus camphoratus]|nr:hypothetical protein AcW2_001474 [Antrodia cinnamomea]KAI0962739.1 hypothetical protein AcW1_000031 [Antrodia cinnamomea]
MATQLSFDEYPSHARGQLSYDMAAALAAKPTPSYPSYPPAGSHSYSHSAHPNRQISYIPFPPAAHPYYSEQANAYVSGYLPSDHMSSYGSLSDQYAPSQWHLPPLAPSQPQYSSIQLPAAGSFVHIPLGHSSLDHGVLHEVPLLPQNPSAAVEHPYQTLLDAQRSAAQPSWSVSGSLNPTTGAFQRAPDGPRLRTAQACEKCRIRKAKCSGEHPSCQRCRARGLLCEYAPERRMRGPNKNKRKSVIATDAEEPSPDSHRRLSVASSCSSASEASPGYRFPDSRRASAVGTSASASPDEQAPGADRELLHPHSFLQDVPSPLRYPMQQSGSATPSQQQASSLRRRPRPPPINLGDAAYFNPGIHLSQQFTPDPAFHAHPPIIDDITPSYAARRASLPSYLLHAYSPSDAASSYTHSRSNSTSDGSIPRPLTPSSFSGSLEGTEGAEVIFPPEYTHIDTGHMSHGVMKDMFGHAQQVAVSEVKGASDETLTASDEKQSQSQLDTGMDRET